MKSSTMMLYRFVVIIVPCLFQKSSAQSGVDCNSAVSFLCGDGSCISAHDYCNGEKTCTDNSDEMPYNQSLHHNLGMECQSNTDGVGSCFLSERYMCDSHDHCKNGADEANCSHTFFCESGDQYVLKEKFCDYNKDCLDNSDERAYYPSLGGFQCPTPRKSGTKICVLPEAHVCDNSSDCTAGIDECFCEDGKQTDAYFNDKCFRCLDGLLVIPKYQLCDGLFHCKDLSDECLCGEDIAKLNTSDICDRICSDGDCDCRGRLQCIPNAARTSSSICLQPRQVCDFRMDCADGADEIFCPFLDEYMTCDDGTKKVQKIYQCDGKDDCDDGSDELGCHEKKFICEFYNPRSTDAKWTHAIGWNDSDSWPKMNRTALQDDFMNEFGMEWSMLFHPYYADACDGIPTCLDYSDECGSNKRREDCAVNYSFCGENNGKCSGLDYFLVGSEICDGIPTCNKSTPEASEDEMFCPGRFYCNDLTSARLPIHIPTSHRCDLNIECYDRSDEMNCSTDTHFYCDDEGSTLFVPMSKRCDKRVDCMEARDECDGCIQDIFSSDESLISSRILVAFLWILGLISTLGNGIVVCHQISTISKKKVQRNQVTLTNRTLVLNLAFADLLLGIYLLFLGIKDATVTKYCQTDLAWRSSATCASLGVIAVIGTETSVFTLLIMTSHRLHVVFRPLVKKKFSTVLVSVMFSWVVSIVLATAPLAPSAAEYFLSCVWFASNPFFGLACKQDVTTFTEKLVALTGPESNFSRALGSSYTWKSMLQAQTVLNSSNVPELYFGYYSAHSVCLPRLFPDKKDGYSWEYSLFLILLNFFAFLYIMVGYIGIFKQGTHRRVDSCNTKEMKSRSVQRKVTRIIFTDFICWVPICVMAFLKVSGIQIGDIAYAVTAIILLPINSAMNPFLYSPVIDIMMKRFRRVRRSVSKRSFSRSERGSTFLTKNSTKVSDVGSLQRSDEDGSNQKYQDCNL